MNSDLIERVMRAESMAEHQRLGTADSDVNAVKLYAELRARAAIRECARHFAGIAFGFLTVGDTYVSVQCNEARLKIREAIKNDGGVE